MSSHIIRDSSHTAVLKPANSAFMTRRLPLPFGLAFRRARLLPLMITMMLEALLPKRRLLEIYLNSVEWGEGVFGAEAAAQRHFRTAASRLTPAQAARLAVMLPAPKRYEKQFRSAYLDDRTATIIARMGAADLP